MLVFLSKILSILYLSNHHTTLFLKARGLIDTLVLKNMLLDTCNKSVMVSLITCQTFPNHYFAFASQNLVSSSVISGPAVLILNFKQPL
jgi:hypothetical protein